MCFILPALKQVQKTDSKRQCGETQPVMKHLHLPAVTDRAWRWHLGVEGLAAQRRGYPGRVQLVACQG